MDEDTHKKILAEKKKYFRILRRTYAIGYESCDLPHNEPGIRHTATADQ